MSDAGSTKADLQKELRRRDLPISGTKDDLRRRLEESDAGHDPAAGDGTRGADSTSDEDSGTRRERLRPEQVARLGARQLAELTRRTVEGVAGLARDEDGWRVEVEVVEVARVPSSTDVIGLYAVWVDQNGELLGYERVERFVRGRASHEEG